MSIEKMTFAHISGPVSDLDAVLLMVLDTGMLQPEYTSKLSEYSVADPMPLQNPYADVLVRVGELAGQLGVSLEQSGKLDVEPESREQYLADVGRQLDDMDNRHQKLFRDRAEIREKTGAYETAIQLLARMDEAHLSLSDLSDSSFLQISYGKLPEERASMPELEALPVSLHVIQRENGFCWCIYVTTMDHACKVDALFRQAGFEKATIPKAIWESGSGAKAFLKLALENAQAEAAETAKSLDRMADEDGKLLQELHCSISRFHNAYDLRKYTVTMHGKFHLIGYLLNRDAAVFRESVAGICTTQLIPCHGDIPHLQTPVKLRNGRFSRPFEMFVDMYGTPSYNGMDPTPFVAWSYSILFGVMFGDVGQGLCIALLGWLLHRKKGMSLGPIMMRIGVVSALFGLVYGSVFGYEHLLDPLYHSVLGLPHKPVEVLEPATTNILLLSAVGIGILLIILVMFFNICVGIRQRSISRIFLSGNGLPGLVFFVAAVVAVLSAFMGKDLLTGPYVGVFLALPLLIMFFKEPLERLIHFYSADSIIHHSRNLSGSIRFSKLDESIHALFGLKYVYARFGRMPTDSFEKLAFYTDDPFIIHPIKSDRDYIWCVYTAAATDRKSVDAVFHDLFFERVYIPEDMLESSDLTQRFIKRCIEEDQIVPTSTGSSRKRSLLRRMFPNGIGSFFAESFFELFEILLSFVTNTMSFLRVGGFILSHAGMMSVVMALSEMAGGGASPVIVVVGNLFVMGLEGLIVGIQVLRLEFYELFSRFYDGGGEPFRPVAVQKSSPAS